MSRPSGFSPRSQNLPSRPSGRPYESDSYRPLHLQDHYSSYHDHQPYHQRDEMYYFRGNNANDIDRAAVDANYSSTNRGGTQPAPKPGGDSYRPGRDGFSFRKEPPPSLDLNRTPSFHRDRSPHSNDRRSNYRNDHRSNQHDRHRQRVQGHDSRVRDGFSRKAVERPMLQTKRDPTPELMPGMEEEDSAGVKYRAVEDMSDSDEADMDLSSNEEAGTIESPANEEPKKKQTRTDLRKSADGDSVPRWSNPDPYTVLPPVDEAQRKKKDVVKLIRKARIVSGLEDIQKPEAISDDFISFDFDDESGVDNNDDGSISNDESHPGVVGAPTGPRAYSRHGNLKDKLPHLASAPKSSRQLDTTTDPALGNRKRTIDDNIKAPAPKPQNRSSKKIPATGYILEEWRVPTGSASTPWCTVDHSSTENMGHWLHKEIMDFYFHFKPTDFEDSIRHNLVKRLRDAVHGRWRDADIQPFGSFVAGLYLPTADMDLVFVSNDFLSGYGARYNQKKFLTAFRLFLEKGGFPAEGTIELILNAKVPIVKYVDKITGLRVDVSFENNTGLVANHTFQMWKHQYPAMPILVTLIKQFLAMRGLNEPVNGGIGGFSVTCLVVSLLQLMPQVQSGNMIAEHHLGEILMEFFHLYGNEFKAATTAIQVDPPGYVAKAHVRTVVYKNIHATKLSIIDPNNPHNDIAGGSGNTATILKVFSQAFSDLSKRMGDLHFTSIAERKGMSILGAILAGDYSSFDTQRDRLHRCHRTLTESSDHERFGV